MLVLMVAVPLTMVLDALPVCIKMLLLTVAVEPEAIVNIPPAALE